MDKYSVRIRLPFNGGIGEPLSTNCYISSFDVYQIADMFYRRQHGH